MECRRQFIHHPEEIPVQLYLDRLSPQQINSSASGGVVYLDCFQPSPLPNGCTIQLSIPSLGTAQAIPGTIINCTPRENGCLLTIMFAGDERAMQIRMLEQLCQIQCYRNRVKNNEGRVLNYQEAALEWITKYAALFPYVAV